MDATIIKTIDKEILDMKGKTGSLPLYNSQL